MNKNITAYHWNPAFKWASQQNGNQLPLPLHDHFLPLRWTKWVEKGPVKNWQSKQLCMKPGLSVLALVKYLACCQEWIWSHSRSAMLTWILLILRSGIVGLYCGIEQGFGHVHRFQTVWSYRYLLIHIQHIFWVKNVRF